jgi:2-hydroxy-3-oxopropionate reductase
MNIGFIGLGIMGKPMAGHLIAGGHSAYLYSRSGVAQELLDAGGKGCASPADVAKSADIIFMMVPDTPDVEKVLFGKDGVAEGLAPGKVVVDMSSIAPLETRKFAARINEQKCDYIDAPVSGGEVGARNAALTIMCGGTEAAFNRVKPLFELMGKNITLVGGNGDGQTCKVANQIIVALTIEAVGEALLFASKAGADPARVRQALMGGFANSRILEVHGERMVKRTFNPGFRIELHQKDLNLALAGARALGVSLPNTAIGARAVQFVRRPRRRRLGPLGDGARAGDDGESPGSQGDPDMLTLEDALRITHAARRAATENNWNVVIAVVDDGGHLISLQRMDGTQKGSVRVAEQKARTAIMFKRPTKAFEDMVLQGRPVMMTMPDVICLEGGLPLIRDGVYVGAIGVSGVKSSEDGIVAAQGASALAES